MTNNTQWSFLLFITTLLVIFPCIKPAKSQVHANDLISSKCAQTPDPKLCEVLIGSDPRSSTIKDAESLALLVLDIVKSKFSDSINYVKGMTRKTHDPVIIGALNNCVGLYNIVVNEEVKSAIYAVETGNPKFGEEAMVGSGNGAEACPSGFKDGKVPFGLTGRTRTLHGICNVAAVIIKSL